MNNEELAAGLAPTPGYRYVDVVGRRLYVAGQVPLDANGDLIGVDDPKLQATTCLDNLGTIIGLHDFSITDIRQLTIYVVGEHQNLLDSWSAVTEWFDDDVPPATLLGLNGLGYRQQLVEIDATIEKDE